MDALTEFQATPAQSKYLRDWQFADDYFRALMNILNHEDSVPFAQKEAMVANYTQMNNFATSFIRQLSEKLDRINPAYVGRSRLNTCGEVFWVKQGEWQDMADGAIQREDSYLHVDTQKIHTLLYAFHNGMKTGTIALNGTIVWGTALEQKVNNYSELPALGVNQLLIRIRVLAF